MPRFGVIEAGGTKFVCAVGSEPGDLSDEVRFPTTTPAETLKRCVEFFRARGALDALGIGCFGPVDLDRASSHYGFITKTTKAGWSDTEVAGTLGRALGLRVGFDTDVNAAVLGEARWGSARGVASAVYLTVGTGIGGGAILDGTLVHGLVHPEMGHLRVPREPGDDFAGVCRFHGAACWEGMASGPAMQARWGKRAEELPAEHPAWDLEARYLASGLVSIVLTLSPHRIILAGGVMQSPERVALTRKHLLAMLAGYVGDARLTEHVDEYLVQPGLGTRSGIAGALILAERAASAGR
jgi:fructokinase